MADGRRWQALFVSDVHLDTSLPHTTRAFLNLLGGQARESARLFLCGDLFEYWAGDDDLDAPYHRTVVGELRAVAEAGVEIGWLPGNRDFLVGNRFAEAAGLMLLDEPCVLELSGRKLVVTHGDALCTDDVSYQAFRAMVRQPAWQQAFVSRPLAERKAIIAGMREQSMAGKSAKAMEIMDVNPAAVQTLFDASGASVMIHGHTHRPARHEAVKGDAAWVRHVLPDWECDHGARRGGWLTVDVQGGVHRFDVDGNESSFDHP